MKKLLLLLFGFLILVFSSAAVASTISVDLNDFTLDGTGSIITATNGDTSAILSGYTILVNDPDPTLTPPDPGISVPSNVLSLNFTYDFTGYIDDSDLNDIWEDEFYVQLWNATETSTTYLNDIYSIGFYSSEDSISIDLTGLASDITLLGLEFSLDDLSGIDIPTVSISNVYFETEDVVAPVPEPSTFILFGFGLFGIAGIGRKKLMS